MKNRKKIAIIVDEKMREVMFIGQIFEVTRFENVDETTVAILRELPIQLTQPLNGNAERVQPFRPVQPPASLE